MELITFSISLQRIVSIMIFKIVQSYVLIVK